MQVVQPGLEMALIWHASTTGRDLTHYATASASPNALCCTSLRTTRLRVCRLCGLLFMTAFLSGIRSTFVAKWKGSGF